MLLGLITFITIGGWIIYDYLQPPKSKSPEEKLGEALTGYLKSIQPKGK